MKFDLLTVLRHFVVKDGTLYRKLATGLRQVRLVDRGRLAVVVEGRRMFGPDLAWACIYLAVPMYPVVQVNGDPFDMREDNLQPCRLGRLKCRVTRKSGGYCHPLSWQVFPTMLDCRANWVTLATAKYKADKPYVRQLEDDARGRAPVVPVHRPVPRRVCSTDRSRASRPAAVEGRAWHWWQGAWLSLPEPVHCSDDWMVRAAIVETNPQARFVYDPVAEKTVAVV